MKSNRPPRISVRVKFFAGFTLLEVLLTSLLASVVMLALWSLSDIYLRMFASGRKKVEETQIVRGLTSLLAKDLSQVTQLADFDPNSSPVPGNFSTAMPTPNPAQAGLRGPSAGNQSPTFSSGSNLAVNDRFGSGTIPVAQSMVPRGTQSPETLTPRFGLFGTKQALRLIVLQTDPRTTREPLELADFVPQPGQARTPVATELRTIEYTFLRQHDSTIAEQQHPGGFVRREWAWETWAGNRLATRVTAASGASTSLLPGDFPEWTAADDLSLKSGRDLFHVPQITAIEFRYYDGQKWEEEWDSWERRKLPLLVELLFRIKTIKGEDPSQTDGEAIDDSGDSLSLAQENSTRRSTSAGRVYRRLVHLPFADRQIESGNFDQIPRIVGVADSQSPALERRGRQP